MTRAAAQRVEEAIAATAAGKRRRHLFRAPRRFLSSPSTAPLAKGGVCRGALELIRDRARVGPHLHHRLFELEAYLVEGEQRWRGAAPTALGLPLGEAAAGVDVGLLCVHPVSLAALTRALRALPTQRSFYRPLAQALPSSADAVGRETSPQRRGAHSLLALTSRAPLQIPPVAGHSTAGRFLCHYGSFLSLRKRRGSSAPGSVPSVWGSSRDSRTSRGRDHAGWRRGAIAVDHSGGR